MALPSPNSFLVPTAIISLIPKLSKEEIVCLLYLLSGNSNKATTLTVAINKLIKAGIINRQLEIQWTSSKDKMTINVQKVVEQKEDLSSDLLNFKDDVHKLMLQYKEYIVATYKDFTSAHRKNWIQAMRELSVISGFGDAIKKAYKDQKPFPSYVKKLMDGNETPEEDLTAWT